MPNTTTPNSQQLDWFPVDAAKTLSHQDLLGLKLQELGAFWMLRLFCWKDGSVPASPKRLAVLCRSTEKQMTRLLGRLSHLLEPHPERPDRLIMPLVEDDRPEGLETKRATRLDSPEPELLPQVPDEEIDLRAEESSDAPVETTEPVSITTATAAAPPAKLSRVPAPPREPVPEEKESEPPPEVPVPGEGKPPRKKMSFFMEQESVFDAHDLSLCALGKVRGEGPERFKPERHYRMKASRRRAVAAAIREVGLDVARKAARNATLATHLHSGSEFHPLDIEPVLRNAEQIAQLFSGPDADLSEAIRKYWQASKDPQRGAILERAPAPWSPPPEPSEPNARRLF